VINRKLKISGNVLFRETQQFRVGWIWMILIACVLMSIGLTAAVGFDNKAGRQAMGVALAFIIPLETGMLYLFYIVQLQTIVTTEGVFYRWWPFFKRYGWLSKEEIAEAKPGKGPALSYGFHIVPGFGRVHNTGPGKGIQIVLKNDRKVFIGTQKLNAFQAALEEIL
jgi:hypothetical protein